MANKSKIYTRTGDKGQTALVGGTRVNKWDTRLEAYGTIDELNSFLGWLLQMPEVEEEVELLRFVQNKLFVIGSYLATDVSFAELRDASKLKVDDVLRIEQRIDELDAQLPKITNFILPGGTQAASVAHICRTICRRAERRICELASQCSVDSNLLSFMNRLSDYLFVFARFNNYKTSGNEIYWDNNC